MVFRRFGLAPLKEGFVSSLQSEYLVINRVKFSSVR